MTNLSYSQGACPSEGMQFGGLRRPKIERQETKRAGEWCLAGPGAYNEMSSIDSLSWRVSQRRLNHRHTAQDRKSSHARQSEKAIDLASRLDLSRLESAAKIRRRVTGKERKSLTHSGQIVGVRPADLGQRPPAAVDPLCQIVAGELGRRRVARLHAVKRQLMREPLDALV